MQSFHLPKELIINLETLGYKQFTPIQSQVLKSVTQGRDIVAQAKTGSGKTAAFGIPLILKIDIKKQDPQALIICPTRELVQQVAKELGRIAKYKANLKILTLYGGVPMAGQIASLKNGAHIIVSTPGRLQDHLSRETMKLYEISMLVLDEADKMQDKGFIEAINKIISNLPKNRQTFLFSATFGENVQKLSQTIVNNPLYIKVDTLHDNSLLQEIAYEFKTGEKDKKLLELFSIFKPSSSIIFCNTKIQTIKLTEYLRSNGFMVLDLQGDLDQYQRNETLIQFANNSIPVLVATDVAARGLDIKKVEMIINYDLPHKKETYTHRIGRTARMDTKGIALSLYHVGEKVKLKEIAPDILFELAQKINIDKNFIPFFNKKTLCINGGKKNKLRATDILGILCKDVLISSDKIGKIDIEPTRSYVAIDKSVIKKAVDGINKSKIKKRRFKAWQL